MESEQSPEEQARPTLSDHIFKLLGLGAALLLALGTVVYHFLEDWSWVDSFYFSAVAVTTVGFGDLTPTRDASKLFTVVYIFVGFALITTYLNERFHRLPERIQKRRRSQ